MFEIEFKTPRAKFNMPALIQYVKIFDLPLSTIREPLFKYLNALFKTIIIHFFSIDCLSSDVAITLSFFKSQGPYYSRHRFVLANKIVCKLLEQALKTYNSNQIHKIFSYYSNILTPRRGPCRVVELKVTILPFKTA